MMRLCALILAALMALSMSSCNQENTNQTTNENVQPESAVAEEKAPTESEFDGTVIELSDDGTTVDGEAISEDETAAVYTANDIVFYLEGQDFTYGEGTETDEHSQEEADKHTVVHITKPGDYQLSGKLSAGQIAVDLGEDAEEDPNAVVNLYLNGVDITCTVAPGVIFYNVYECGSDDEESATYEVDTSAAGANVYIMDGSENTVNGSYVARIYKSVELSEDGKTVVDSKKLHKYDAAFYSKKSMNVYGDTGILNINAENEGLDSELHLTINGGIININSGNDGINTNEDGISVTTINGGSLNINVNGSTGEGDGIDSNGWLVINGGKVTSSACSFSGDAGIDSEMGIHVNGGTVIATGNMYDRLEEGSQNYAVLTFAETQKGGQTYSFRSAEGLELFSLTPANDFIYLILSDPDLTEGSYSLWCGETQLAHSGSGMGGFGGGMMGRLPGNIQKPEGSDDKQPQEMPQNGEMMKSENMQGKGSWGEAFQKNEDGTYTLPDGSTVTEEELQQQMEAFRGENGGFGGRGQRPDGMQDPNAEAGEASADFNIVSGANLFNGVSALTETNA
ncbi:MAG: carbohydrate-binding domain-containing protein [Oscillospiraceae bacterium]|nr:carbohydrate-binding domain-containing protein [Oscillospiraceae bacterium]